MSLSENIYRLRTEKNMSQLDLADALEVSRQSVSKWETGTAVPELDKLVKMANLFEISLDELVNGEASPARKASAPPEAPEPRVIYVEKAVFPTMKRQYIIGAVLLFLSLIYGVILYEGFSMEETVSLVLPVAACGAVFLLTSHPLFWCGWICAFGYWDHFFVFFPMPQGFHYSKSSRFIHLVHKYLLSISYEPDTQLISKYTLNKQKFF